MSFFSILLTALGVLFAALVIILAYKAYKGWVDLDFYRNQGIKSYYNPLLGFVALMMPPKQSGERRGDVVAVRYAADTYGRGVFAANRPCGDSPVVAMINSDYIKEFLLKEDAFERKNFIEDFPLSLGFFFASGESAMHKRSIFQKVMLYDELKKFTPLILKLTYEAFAECIKEKKVSNCDYTKINIEKVYSKIIEGISMVTLFGNYNLSEESIEVLIQRDAFRIFHLFLEIVKNPVFNMFPWFFYKFPFLNTTLKKFYKVKEDQKERITKYMKSREGESPQGGSVMDKIIALNTECKRTGNMTDYFDTEEVFGTLNVISLASNDTSHNSAMLNLCMLAENKELRDIVTRISDELYDSHGLTTPEKIESHQMLSRYFKEAMRLGNAAPGTFARVALKDVKILDVNIRKGDAICIFYAPLNFDPNVFKNPEEFDIDRFSPEREKTYPRYQVSIFGAGKRVCIGRHLGELTVKLLITSFCNMFEFRKPADVEYYDDIVFTKIASLPFIDVKLRQ